jgi:hypothetical protein
MSEFVGDEDEALAILRYHGAEVPQEAEDEEESEEEE